MSTPVVDRLTKMAQFIPSHDNVDAEGVVTLFMDHVVTKHGLPDDIVSDRGPVFTAQFTRAFMQTFGVKQNLSTAFHPQLDGQAERTNATLEQYIVAMLHQLPAGQLEPTLAHGQVLLYITIPSI
jgi:transposase InsO family protein